ncbi:hypothetical protein R4Z10_09485 [Niallia sp. XMNu-256]|uniref:hypothetical protein n=1 Tax=Niallia sp. XMNu-256 TaxID=3082444 RepID=UPI0030D41B33
MNDSFFQKESYESMKKKYEKMLERQQPYEKLVDLMKQINVWDYSIYDETPGDDWVALDRKDYEQIVTLMQEFYQISPWKEKIERRIDS